VCKRHSSVATARATTSWEGITEKPVIKCQDRLEGFVEPDIVGNHESSRMRDENQVSGLIERKANKNAANSALLDLRGGELDVIREVGDAVDMGQDRSEQDAKAAKLRFDVEMLLVRCRRTFCAIRIEHSDALSRQNGSEKGRMRNREVPISKADSPLDKKTASNGFQSADMALDEAILIEAMRRGEAETDAMVGASLAKKARVETTTSVGANLRQIG